MNPLVGVVPGGTRGIGLGLAEYLVQQGARVAVTYRTHEDVARKARRDLDQPAGEATQLVFLKGDAREPEVVSR
ncbi:MAG: SDR family NAD(P)-dependent oxidoreductase, partial [Desulfohalobiaceae bacterium]|nr:SDR family NAD(P)-dependent oxidoreductase [Desulfohalobiaceae bacterium]